MKQILHIIYCLFFVTACCMHRSILNCCEGLQDRAAIVLQLNMDAVYNRPFIQVGKLPVALVDMLKPIINMSVRMEYQ